DGVEAFVPLKFTSAGIMPAYWGSLLIGLPISIFGFIDFERVQKTYYFLTIYFIVYAIVTIFFYYLFTALFYSPKKMAIFLKNKSAVIVSHSGENQETFIDRKLELMIPIAAIYLCLVIYVPKILSRVFYSSLDGIGLIIAVAIILDLMEELRLRKKGVNLVKIAELHDVPMAGLLKSLLEQKGLPCFLRGYYHRALLYFFGPYIEISVLVPEDKMADAIELVTRYIDSNLLIANVRA
ncbi:MAG: putative signal transducing protein, partial [Syntrophales bacterium]